MFSSPCTFYFNPRSHERSDTPIAIPTTPAQFQSTLPREERLSNVDFKSIPYISIHAPTRGATKDSIATYFKLRISIHAPTRGATRDFQHFNFTVLISIHAPTRGATKNIVRLGTVQSVFQSTLPREERLTSYVRNIFYFIFQSTLPREERRLDNETFEKDIIFQSTLPREERRLSNQPH